jgi:hypothetical protein
LLYSGFDDQAHGFGDHEEEENAIAHDNLFIEYILVSRTSASGLEYAV